MLRFNRFAVITLLWAAIIFATSCSFIERSVFIRFIEQFLPSWVPHQWWVTFWLVCGLFVVKGYHVSEFAFLTWLLRKMLRPVFQNNPTKAILIPALLAAIYAISDEWHQTFIPGRGGTWVDVVIDCGGIALVTLPALYRLRQSRRLAAQIA